MTQYILQSGGRSLVIHTDPATTAPPAPTGLTATAASFSQINLSWSESGAATGFVVQRSPDGSTWTTIASPGSSPTNYSSTGLSSATLYYYRVSAVGSGGASTYSTTASATTSSGSGSPPAAPTSLQAAALDAHRTLVTWRRGDSTETGFTVYRRDGGSGSYNVVATLPARTGVFVDPSPSPGAAVSYKVAATNASGSTLVASPAGATMPATTATFTPALSVTATTPTSVSLSWTTNVSETALEMSADGGVTWAPLKGFGDSSNGAVTPETWTASGLAPATNYQFRSFVSDNNGNLGPYAIASTTTPARTAGDPVEPSGLSLLAVAGSPTPTVSLSWANPGGAAVKVERAPYTGLNSLGDADVAVSFPGTFAVVATTAVGATSYSDATVSAESSYYYRVRSTSGTGDSDPTPFLFVITPSPGVGGSTYTIGHGTAHATLGSFDWTSLKPGDTLNITAKVSGGVVVPYYEKVLVSVRGTAALPITVNGVADPTTGHIPILDGTNATTDNASYPGQFAFGNEARGLLSVSYRNGQGFFKPGYLTIRNLQLQAAYWGDNAANANPSPWLTFTGSNGAVQQWSQIAAGAYVVYGDNVTVQGCTATNNGIGIFNGGQAGDARSTTNLTLRGNTVSGNGIIGSSGQHNSYTEAVGFLAEGNSYLPLRPGATGNGMKDRSTGGVYRYNSFRDGGGYMLDLVEPDHSAPRALEVADRRSYVYGNIFDRGVNATNGGTINVGGDQGPPQVARCQPTYFYHNTVVYRSDSTTLASALLVRDPVMGPLSVTDARNNLAISAASAAGHAASTLDLTTGGSNLYGESNWVGDGYQASRYGGNDGTVYGPVRIVGPTSFTASDVGLADLHGGNWTPLASSPLVDAAGPLPADVQANHPVTMQYSDPASIVARPTQGTGLDVGAIES